MSPVSSHPAIEGVIAIETGPREKRVIAVEWVMHDALSCDGNDLDIDTDDFLRCPVSACRWSYDPEFACPDHKQAVS